MLKKYGGAVQATDVTIIRRMRIAYWILKATNTHNIYYLLLSHGKSVFATAPHCYVVLILMISIPLCVLIQLI
jgi:hypothetical protein